MGRKAGAPTPKKEVLKLKPNLICRKVQGKKYIIFQVFDPDNNLVISAAFSGNQAWKNALRIISEDG